MHSYYRAVFPVNGCMQKRLIRKRSLELLYLTIVLYKSLGFDHICSLCPPQLDNDGLAKATDMIKPRSNSNDLYMSKSNGIHYQLVNDMHRN